MKILKAPYQLEYSDGSGFQRGSLIKIIEKDAWGVADICPHPHLGDNSIEDEIKNQGPLFVRALFLAQQDLKARKEAVALVSDEPIAANALSTNYRKANGSTIKVKAGPNFELLTSLLENLSHSKVRLDFNFSLSANQFQQLLPKLGKNIEYIEDPTPFQAAEWEIWNRQIPLAFDFPQVNPFHFLKAWTYLIIKPTRQNAEQLVALCDSENKKYTLTSSMDHPVGIAHGLHYAQRHSDMVSGFSTLNLFKETKYHSYFTENNNSISFHSLGYGVGLTEILNQENWVSL